MTLVLDTLLSQIYTSNFDNGLKSKDSKLDDGTKLATNVENLES